MKRHIIALSIALPLCAGGIEKDKQLHFAAGFIIGGTVTLIAERMDLPYPKLWGITASALAGALKEALDRRKPGNYWNGRDLSATVAGGITVSFVIRF